MVTDPRAAVDLLALPLFANLDEAQAERVLAAANERSFAMGELLIGQWEGSRELYVVLEGEAAVSVEGDVVVTVGVGETIGEIAALDWGAGFGYVRTATAQASTSLRTLVIPSGDVGELIREIPALGERLRTVAQSRLHRA